MIVSIKHKAIENFFQKGKGLSGFTVGQKEEMRYWISILHAVSSKEDFTLSGGKFYDK